MPFDADDAFEAAGSQRKFPMHSHDRTLLASLGFADPDKKNPEHNRICRYLAMSESTTRIGKWLHGYMPAPKSPVQLGYGSLYPQTRYSVTDHPELKCEVASEYHLTKGSGTYQTTVGFADLLLKYSLFSCYTTTHTVTEGKGGQISVGGRWVDPPEVATPCEPKRAVNFCCSFRVVVEVKVAILPVEDILRQIELYCTYVPQSNESYEPRRAAVPKAIVAAPWDMSEGDIKLLAGANVAFLKVSDEYKKWAEAEGKKVGTPGLVL